MTDNKSVELIDVKAAAEIIGVSRQTLYRYLAAGAIRSFRVGGRRLFQPRDVHRFINRAPDSAISRLINKSKRKDTK